MDLTSFSHGQIQSKLWLCDLLEPHVPDNSPVVIHGAWYNVLGFMLMTRNPNKYQSITGIDIDPSVRDIANNICQAWMIHPTATMNNVTQDSNLFNHNGYTTVINCSVEHMESTQWFDNIPEGTTVCLQSSNVNDPGEVWKITNPNTTFDMFIEKYPLSKYYFSGKKEIEYTTGGYTRYMIIGLK